MIMDNFIPDLLHHQIYGIGSDICNMTRIANVYKRFDKNFLEKTFSSEEIAYFHRCGDLKKIPFLAKRFAAKEAVVKAMQTGFGQNAFMKDISTIPCLHTGKPLITLSGRAYETANRLSDGNGFELFISLSDETNHALAFCVFALVRKVNKL